MKKIIMMALFLSSLLTKAQNSMLNPDFWKAKPGIDIVMQEIVKGNSPSEANRGNHDVVSFAINNEAPFETITFLISQEGNSVDKITHDGRIYLHWAASRGNVELVDYLIKQGSDINRTDDKGATPVSFAAGNGQTNIAIYEAFFKAGIKPGQKYKDGANLLLLSVSGDKDLTLASYFESKGLSLNDTDEYGRTAFDYAARGGNVELLKKLKAKGVKHTDNALIIAAQGSRWSAPDLNTYKYLVEDLKINPAAKGLDNETVLHHLVTKRDQDENIQYFLAKGLDVNEVDKNGNSIFIKAASTNNLKLVQSLLPKVKDINYANQKGETALVAAVQSGSPEIVEFLIKNKANPKIQTQNGNLAYHLIQSYRPARPGENADAFSKKFDILNNNGVDFVTPQKDGNTLYHIAVNKNDLYLFKTLEKLNIDVNVVNNEGMTALHKAALVAKDDKILKHLIALGADKKIRTEFDESAYDIASENESLIENKIAIDFLK